MLSRRKLLGLSLGAAGATLAPIPRWMRRALAQDTSGADYSHLGALENIHVVDQEWGPILLDSAEWFWGGNPHFPPLWKANTWFHGNVSKSAQARQAWVQAQYDAQIMQQYEQRRLQLSEQWLSNPEMAFFGGDEAAKVMRELEPRGLSWGQQMAFVRAIGAALGMFVASERIITMTAIPTWIAFANAIETGAIVIEVISIGFGALVLSVTGLVVLGAAAYLIYVTVTNDPKPLAPTSNWPLPPGFEGDLPAAHIEIDMATQLPWGMPLIWSELNQDQPAAEIARQAFVNNPYYWPTGQMPAYCNGYCQQFRFDWGAVSGGGT